MDVNQILQNSAETIQKSTMRLHRT